MFGLITHLTVPAAAISRSTGLEVPQGQLHCQRQWLEPQYLQSQLGLNPEGQATFFETYLETSSRSRSQVIERLKQSPTGIASSSLTTLEQKLSNDSVCNGDQNIAYDLGMLAFEYLYMNFSFQQIHDLQVLSSKEGWNSAVRTSLGIDPAALNRSISEHINRELQ